MKNKQGLGVKLSGDMCSHHIQSLARQQSMYIHRGIIGKDGI